MNSSTVSLIDWKSSSSKIVFDLLAVDTEAVSVDVSDDVAVDVSVELDDVVDEELASVDDCGRYKLQRAGFSANSERTLAKACSLLGPQGLLTTVWDAKFISPRLTISRTQKIFKKLSKNMLLCSCCNLVIFC